MLIIKGTVIMKKIILMLFLLLPVLALSKDKVEALKPLTLTNKLSAKAYKDIFFSGQPTEEQLKELKKQGFATVISLRGTSENAGYDEEKVAKSHSLKFFRIPIKSAKAMTPEKVNEITKTIVKNRPNGRVLVHCASGGRVGLWAGAHFKNDHGYSEADAMKVAQEIGMSKSYRKILQSLMKDTGAAKK